MKNILIINFFCFFSCLFAQMPEQKTFQRIQSHLLIGDYNSAKQEAESFLNKSLDSNRILKAYIKSLALCLDDQESLKMLTQFQKLYPSESIRDISEEICWSILRKCLNSNQYSLRLAALIGAYLTKDSKTIPLIITALNDSHSLIRSIAVQLACGFSDQPLKREILSLFEKEKIWIVRLELIKAVGIMKLKEKENDLKMLLENDRVNYEEKQASIQSLIALHDDFSLEYIKKLALSPKASMRSLACDITIHFQKKEAQQIILSLLNDSRSDVKISAIKAICFLFIFDFTKEEILIHLKNALEDPDPLVNITASWALMLKDPSKGIGNIKRWLSDTNTRYQVYAASALASSGCKAIKYMNEVLNSSKNSFVRANLAMGLIGLNKNIRKCCDVLFDFLKKEDQNLMIGLETGLPFRVLEPSRIRHVDQIPNYPQAVDQITKLSLLSLLAMMEDSRAKDAIKSYLLKEKWGITGFAAATLLKEGDEDCLDIIRGLLKDENPQVRLQASLVLALYGKEENAISSLEKSYDEVDHHNKLYILEALGHIGNEKVVPFLLNVLHEPFMMRRVIAASALLQSLYH